MKILVDTHCWLWWMFDSRRLNANARSVLADEEADVFFSVASGWEISIKYNLKKLTLPVPPNEYIPARLEEQGMTILPLTLDHVLRAGSLPDHHRDPFDRAIVAQAAVEGLRLMTADAHLQPYDVEILWAGT